MKTFISPCIVLILIAATAGTAHAQRTSSAVQTVTFGVHRSSQSILRTVSLVQRTVHPTNSSEAVTLQDMAPASGLKVTVQTPVTPASNDGSTTAVQSTMSGSFGSGSPQGGSHDRIDGESSCGGSAIVVTITQ